MSASVIVSEDIFLTLLWQMSAALAGLSVVVLFLLVISRIFSSKKEARRLLRYKILSQYFYAAIASPVEPTKDSLPVLSNEDRTVVCRIALDILRTVKGGDAQRIVKLLDAWEIQPLLLKMLGHSRRGVKIQAVSLLAYFSSAESLQALLSCCEDPDTYVQMAALRGLSARRDAAHISQIIQSLSVAKKANKLMLADILKRFGEPAVPSLVGLSSGKALVEVRLAALIALGSIRSLNAVEPLIKLLNDENENIRAQSAQALGKIGDIRAGTSLMERLTDTNASVRHHAAQALGALHLNESIPALAGILNDQNWWVRFRAAEALYNIGDKGRALLKALSRTQDMPGIISAQVLAEKEGT